MSECVCVCLSMYVYTCVFIACVVRVERIAYVVYCVCMCVIRECLRNVCAC